MAIGSRRATVLPTAVPNMGAVRTFFFSHPLLLATRPCRLLNALRILSTCANCRCNNAGPSFLGQRRTSIRDPYHIYPRIRRCMSICFKSEIPQSQFCLPRDVGCSYKTNSRCVLVNWHPILASVYRCARPYEALLPTPSLGFIFSSFDGVHRNRSVPHEQ